jgi:ABC-type dipeptide/oligopeptide/nickel transport system permease subunit
MTIFKTSSSAAIGVVLLLILGFGVMFGPMLNGQNPASIDYTLKLAPPQPGHWLGTDEFGRDVLARILEGGRRSLGAALLVMAGVLLISVVLGVSAAMAGGIVDQVITRIIDMILALPSLVFALALVGVLGPGFGNLVLAMVVSHWASSTRLVRSFVLVTRGQPDILIARQAGMSWVQVVVGHMLPGIMGKLFVIMTLRLGDIIVGISGLSFLGLGVQPPAAEWGAMLSQARLFFDAAPWLLLAPAGCIFLTVMGANLIGEALRDAWDPRLNSMV